MKTILYIHGLESGIHGLKVSYLRQAGFNVIVPRMLIGRVYFQKYIIMGFMMGIIILMISFFCLLIYFLFIGLFLYFYHKKIISKMFNNAVLLQKKTIFNNPHIDCIVASSFGGAIALQISEYNIPTLLLCPAHRKISHYVDADLKEQLFSPIFTNKCIIVHGNQDRTVPIEHSIDLAKHNNIELIKVDDTHSLKKYCSIDNLKNLIYLLLES